MHAHFNWRNQPLDFSLELIYKIILRENDAKGVSTVPTYEYKCLKCGIFEQFQAITEEPLEQCPDCYNPVQRLISKNVGIMFKGSGFYVTDNRKSGGTGDDKPAKKDDPASTPPASSGPPAAAS